VEPQTKSKSSKLLLKIVLLLLLPLSVAGGVIFVVSNYYYDITDQINLLNYKAPTNIARLADDASLTDKARKIFYVHRPELNGKTVFNQNCPIPELTFVLGCYTGDNIYLLDIQKPELEPAEPVTAAHEMLHAAYVRLSDSERQRVDGLLREQFESTKDQRLIDLVAKYEAHDPESVPTELHSIIGTEVAKLNPQLEEYYTQYFVDRSKVIADFQGYEKVFSSLETKIDSLQASLKTTKSKIAKLESTIEEQLEDIDSINTKLKNLEAKGDVSAYNELVPDQNQLVNSYNTNIRSYRSLIKSYNSKVGEVNKIAVRHNDLLNSVNSKYQEIDE